MCCTGIQPIQTSYRLILLLFAVYVLRTLTQGHKVDLPSPLAYLGHYYFRLHTYLLFLSRIGLFSKWLRIFCLYALLSAYLLHVRV